MLCRGNRASSLALTLRPPLIRCFIGCPECDHLSGRRQTDLCGLGKKATLPQYARSVNLKAPRFSELDIYQVRHESRSTHTSHVSTHSAACQALSTSLRRVRMVMCRHPLSCSSSRSYHARVQHNPWSAPGSAPVADACGLAGGSPWDWNRAEAGNYVNTTHARHGQKGTTLPPIPTGIEWKIGGEAEVQWQVRNNHGGGVRVLIRDSPRCSLQLYR